MTDVFIFPYTNYIKTAVVAALRKSFGDPSTFDEYRWTQQETTSKVQIYTAFPKRIFKPPTLVVKAGRGDVSFTVLGVNEELIQEGTSFIPTERKTGGLVKLDIDIEIYAKTTTDREKLTDLVIHFMRFKFRDLFQGMGLAFKNITVGGEREEGYDEALLFRNSVTVSVEQQYVDFITVPIGDIIKDVAVTSIPYEQ